MTYIEELNQLAESNGGLLKPFDVVTFAMNPKTALHSKFQWDDSEAAHQYRLWQARTLIRCTVKVLPKVNVEYRAFVSLKSDRANPGGGYRTTSSVLSRKDSRHALLEQALAELEAIRQKYKGIEELVEVFDAIRRAKAVV